MAVKGVGEETATLISLMLPMFRRYNACVCEERKRLVTRGEAQSYCRALMAGWRTERFYVLCLSVDNQLLGQRLVAEGTLAEVPAYPRTVVETALNYNAHSVVLCHNHPSGSASPSAEDVSSTYRLRDVLHRLGIRLQDHIIVAGNQAYSMLQNGLLEDGCPMEDTEEEPVAADGVNRMPPRRGKRTQAKG